MNKYTILLGYRMVNFALIYVRRTTRYGLYSMVRLSSFPKELL